MTPERLPVSDTAARLGLEVRRHRIRPCPLCGDERRRGPIGIRRDDRGWACHICGATGDAYTLIMATLGVSWPKALEWAGQSTEEPRWDPQPEERPPANELARCLRESRTPWGAPLEYLRSRGLEGAPVRMVAWRPTWLAPGYPLICPTWTGRGDLASCQVWGESGKRWPTGYSSAGTIFANRAARAWLRGGPADLVVVVEGLPDYLTACIMWDAPVVSVASGSSDALRLPDWRGVRCLVATHSDPAGDRYAAGVAEVARGALIRRVCLG